MNPLRPIPLRALEHQAYCARQCALIHGDGVWIDSAHTLAGIRSHRRVDGGRTTTERGAKILRNVPLWSETLGLTGRADVIEVSESGLTPIEYKSGSRHGDAADVQLCGQALCLEEMLGISIRTGYVWFGGSRRRRQVDLNSSLRTRTMALLTEIRAAVDSQTLPKAPNDDRCTECQLRSHCLPEVVGPDMEHFRSAVDSEVFA